MTSPESRRERAEAAWVRTRKENLADPPRNTYDYRMRTFIEGHLAAQQEAEDRIARLRAAIREGSVHPASGSVAYRAALDALQPGDLEP